MSEFTVRKRRAMGLCVVCGKPADGFERCTVHRAENAAKSRRKRRAGGCVECRADTDGAARCAVHLAKQRQRIRNMRAGNDPAYGTRKSGWRLAADKRRGPAPPQPTPTYPVQRHSRWVGVEQGSEAWLAYQRELAAFNRPVYDTWAGRREW
jgi:hypothetical protein